MELRCQEVVVSAVEMLKPPTKPRQQLWDDRHRGHLYSSASAEATPSRGPSLPDPHLQPATVGQVTPQAMEYVVQKRQSGEVGALRSPKKEVRGGHTPAMAGFPLRREALSAACPRRRARAQVVLVCWLGLSS